MFSYRRPLESRSLILLSHCPRKIPPGSADGNSVAQCVRIVEELIATEIVSPVLRIIAHDPRTMFTDVREQKRIGSKEESLYQKRNFTNWWYRAGISREWNSERNEHDVGCRPLCLYCLSPNHKWSCGDRKTGRRDR